jgi:hypothetical protein
LPSPAKRVVTPPVVTVKTPSGPEKLFSAGDCPVNPVARPRNVRLGPEKISTLAFDRSAIKMSTLIDEINLWALAYTDLTTLIAGALA